MQYFCIPEHFVPPHNLVEDVKQFLFRKVPLLLAGFVFQGAVAAEFHEDVIVFGGVALHGLDGDEVVVGGELSYDLDLFLNFLAFFFVDIGDDFGDEHFLGAVVPDGLFDDSEAALTHDLLGEDDELVLLAVEEFG